MRDVDALVAGCKCQACPRQFRADLLVADEIWQRISPVPVGGDKGGGLLCPTCIMERIVDAGLWTVGFASDADALESERSRADRLEKALTRCQHALAMLIDPNNERFNASIQHAWAQCVEAETTARTALGKEDVSD